MMPNLNVISLEVGMMRTKCYLIIDSDSRGAVVIDPGDEAEYIKTILNDHHATLTEIIATHGHFDHVLGVFELQSVYNCPFYMNSKDEFLLKKLPYSVKKYLSLHDEVFIPEITKPLQVDTSIKFFEFAVEIIETPGHTPGSISLYVKDEGILFTGDTLFAQGGVGRTDFSYSNASKLRDSIKKLFLFPLDTVIYPGHGEKSTLEVELEYHKKFFSYPDEKG